MPVRLALMPHFSLQISDWALDGASFRLLASSKNVAQPAVLNPIQYDEVVVELSVGPQGFRPGGFPYLFGSRPLRFKLDTGSNFTVLRGPDAETLLRQHADSIRSQSGTVHYGAGRALTGVPVGTLALWLGQHRLPMQCFFVTPTVLSANQLNPGLYGRSTEHLLGISPFLSDYLVAVTEECVEFFHRPDRRGQAGR